MSQSQNIKQKQYCDKFNKDFKNGPHQKVCIREESPSVPKLDDEGTK